MDESITCTFSTVRERDMDLLFLETIATDTEFCRLLVDLTEVYKGKSFSVVDVELSRTDPSLGESDITVKLNIEGTLCAFLIEDKIDAIAMENQAERYKKRGEKGLSEGEYQDYQIFLFCPKKYYIGNGEAKKYQHLLSYEEVQKYFQKHPSPINSIRNQQITQAIERYKKPTEVIKNEGAVDFNRKYQAYQKRFYPSLHIVTSITSNGWWEHYLTNYGKVYIYHKMQEGTVDLTFPNAADKLSILENMASWLRSHGFTTPVVEARKTGKAGALTLAVPKLAVTKAGLFESIIDQEDGRSTILDECFDAIQSLVEFINLLEDMRSVR